MSKINPRDAYVVFTPPTQAHLEDGNVGQCYVTTADRVKIFLDGEPHRRLAEARRIVPDEVEDAQLEVHRALLRLVTLDGLSFRGVFHAFGSIDGFAEALPDGKFRPPLQMELR